MASILRLSGFDRAGWLRAADWMAVGVAVWIPWSTSLTEIFVVLWLIAFLPTLVLPVPETAALRSALSRAAGALPVLLCIVGALGMLWALDVPWAERLSAFSKFPRFLIIPLLLAHFQVSKQGVYVFYGFLASALLLLLTSWGLAELPGLSWRGVDGQAGIPANNYLRQDSCFLVCTFGLLGCAVEQARAKRWRRVAVLVAVAAFFLGDIFFVVASRTALVVAPLVLLALGWREYRWRGVLAAVLLGVVVGGAVWLSSPYLRNRIATSISEWQAFRTSDAANSTGLHAEFLKKSLGFVEAAPIIGHGTGSIARQFHNAAIGKGGAEAAAPANPHNQIFAVAIQLGAVGTIVLLAMWIAHVCLFAGGGFAALAGFTVVAENFFSSLFNSHLFDTAQGWLYIFGVGVAGGMVLAARKPA